MSKVIDVRNAGGDLVVLGKTLVLPSSNDDGAHLPLDGSIRFNPVAVQVEMCVGGVWRTLAGGSGGSGSGPFPISAITGLQTSLDGKAPRVHGHAMSEVSGLVPALDQKAALKHVHVIDDVINLQGSLDRLTGALAGKANLLHNHTIPDVIGLQTALDERARAIHTHTIDQVMGLRSSLDTLSREKIGVCLPGSPPPDWTFAWTATRVTTFPDDFAGSFGSVQTPPNLDYVIAIKRSGMTVGSITVKTTGAVLFSTVGSTLTLPAGDVLVFVCPSLSDDAMQTISFSLVGAVN